MALENFGNLLVRVILTYYTLYVLSMIFSKNSRMQVKVTNKKLDKLRNVAVKSLDQQKEFLNLRYPKKEKFKWSWGLVPRYGIRIFLFITIFLGYGWIQETANLNISLFWAITFAIIFPILLNLVLERFGIHKSDLTVFLRGGKKNDGAG